MIGMRVLGVDAYRKGPRKGSIGVELDRGAFPDAYINDRLTALLSAVNDTHALDIEAVRIVAVVAAALTKSFVDHS
jgi:hypothetical protein